MRKIAVFVGVALIAALASLTTAPAPLFVRGGFPSGAPAVCNITDVVSDPAAPVVSVNSPTDTVVSTLSATTSGTCTITMSISGTNAASFKLSTTATPTTLEAATTLSSASYSINMVADGGVGAIGCDGGGATTCTKPLTVTTTTPGGLLATLTLVNTSGSLQAANFITPVFGMAFAKGDIPSGTAPTFSDPDGTVYPYSWSCMSATYATSNCAAWSDGSLKFASFMFRVSKTVTGSGTRTVYVKSGGTAPSASGFALSDIYAQDMIVHATSQGANYCRWTGTQSAWLNGDANTWKTLKWMDGDAGVAFETWNHFASTVGGTADPHLETTNYVVALKNSGGTLGGFRTLTRVHQPWYNPSTITGLNWCAFSDLSWEQGGGASTSFVPTWAQSALFTTYSFTCTSGSGTLVTTTPNGFKQGAATSGGGNMSPVIVGSNTCGIAADKMLFAHPVSTSTTNFNLRSNSSSTGGALVTASATGSGTLTVSLAALYYGSVWNADASAHYQYFQGTGSLSADSTIMVQNDPNYLRKSGLIPTWDGALATVPVADNVFTNATSGLTNQWYPGYIYQLSPTTGSPGDRDDLGHETGWAARDFFNQSAGDDVAMRSIGLAGSYLSVDLRDVGTGLPLLIRPPVGGGNYTGPGGSGTIPVSTTARWIPGSTHIVVANPPAANLGLGIDWNVAHMTSYAYWAYLKTGERQYLEILQETATALAASLATTRNISSPYTDYAIIGVIDGTGQPTRAMAWTWREMVKAAAVSPAADPDGSQISNYYRDLSSRNSYYLSQTNIRGLLGSYAQTNGLWTNGSGSAYAVSGTNGFMAWYVGMVANFDAKANENADALDFVTNNTAKWALHAYNTWGGSYVLGPEEAMITPTGFNASASSGSSVITLDSQFSIQATAIASGANVTWGTSSPAFTATATSAAAAGDVSNGDLWRFAGTPAGADQLPSGFATGVNYYMTNLTPLTATSYKFDLSPNCATPGGSSGCLNGDSATKIIPGTSGSKLYQGTAIWITNLLTAPPAAATGRGPTSACCSVSGYLTEAQMVLNWAKANGVSGLTSMLSDIGTRIAAAGTGSAQFAAGPKFSSQACYGLPSAC